MHIRTSRDLPTVAFHNTKQMAVLVRSHLNQNMFTLQLELPLFGKRIFTDGDAMLLMLFGVLL